MKTNLGWETSPPPLCILPKIKCSRKCVEEADSNNTCASNTRGKERVLTFTHPTHVPKNSIMSLKKRKQDPLKIVSCNYSILVPKLLT